MKQIIAAATLLLSFASLQSSEHKRKHELEVQYINKSQQIYIFQEALEHVSDLSKASRLPEQPRQDNDSAATSALYTAWIEHRKNPKNITVTEILESQLIAAKRELATLPDTPNSRMLKLVLAE